MVVVEAVVTGGGGGAAVVAGGGGGGAAVVAGGGGGGATVVTTGGGGTKAKLKRTEQYKSVLKMFYTLVGQGTVGVALVCFIMVQFVSVCFGTL